MDLTSELIGSTRAKRLTEIIDTKVSENEVKTLLECVIQCHNLVNVPIEKFEELVDNFLNPDGFFYELKYTESDFIECKKCGEITAMILTPTRRSADEEIKPVIFCHNCGLKKEIS